ncbi:MAG: phage major capsid protein [Candidatus Dormibacteria bacterium]
MPRTLAEIQTDQAEVRHRGMRLHDQLREVDVRIDVEGHTDGLAERRANLKRGLDNIMDREKELGEEYRAELTERLQNGTLGTESEEDQIGSQRRSGSDDTEVHPRLRADRDQALRTLERCDVMSNRAAVAMEKLVRSEDPSGIGARYIAAVGAPAYRTAFGKLLKHGQTASMRMTPEELEAVRVVGAVEAERAMVEGTGSAGGFALPITIDPTILLTSSGVLNPVRQVADVRQIVGQQLRLVSADTPTATYAAELTEVADSSPTLVQPTAITEKGQAFVPFSIELGQDWAGIEGELAKLLADARDILDAAKFLSGAGSGSSEPQGLFSGAGGLQTTQRVQTATVATTVIGDLYAVKAALASTRFWTNAVFAAHPTTWDTFFRFVGGGNTTEPEPFGSGRGGPFLGTQKIEWSSMDTGSTTTGKKLAIVADWTGYVIADRIGTQVELVPHLFGATNRYPIGARGLYMYWRTGTAVSKPNAFRYLEVK